MPVKAKQKRTTKAEPKAEPGVPETEREEQSDHVVAAEAETSRPPFDIAVIHLDDSFSLSELVELFSLNRESIVSLIQCGQLPAVVRDDEYQVPGQAVRKLLSGTSEIPDEALKRCQSFMPTEHVPTLAEQMRADEAQRAKAAAETAKREAAERQVKLTAYRDLLIAEPADIDAIRALAQELGFATGDVTNHVAVVDSARRRIGEIIPPEEIAEQNRDGWEKLKTAKREAAEMVAKASRSLQAKQADHSISNYARNELKRMSANYPWLISDSGFTH